MKDEIKYQKLRDIIKIYLPEDVHVDDIKQESNFINELNINSANLVDIVLDVEDVFDIRLENEDMEQMQTVTDALEIISKKTIGKVAISMTEILRWAKDKLNVDKRLIFLYCTVYFLWGLGMNWFGAQMEIAKFTFWWQVITCYILYMVPISLLLRNLPFHAQYAYGLIAMGILEFGGYAFKTSYAYPNNLMDQFFGERTFALGMALFFALYFPLGNWAVGRLHESIFKK